MMALQALAAVAGVGVLLAPAVPKVLSWLPSKPAQAGVTYQQAILRLAEVRGRLVATKMLGEDQRKSIDVLTLALVDGSDV
jgi:hypothetical protein